MFQDQLHMCAFVSHHFEALSDAPGDYEDRD